MPALPFAEFIAYLARQGFTIGVEHYLRLQTVLTRMGPDCPPAQLKLLLSPLFATNARQQEEFYRAFDACFASFIQPGTPSGEERPAEEPAPVKEPAPPLRARPWPYIVLGLLLIVLLPAGLYQYQQHQWPFVEQTPVVTPVPAATPTPEIAPEAATPTPTPEPTPEPEPCTAPGQPWWQRYWRPVRWTLLCTPLIVFVLLEGYYRNRRQAVIERRRGRRPARSIPLRIDAPELGFLKQPLLYTAARRLRRRLVGVSTQLDVNATVAHTLRHAGFPQMRYRPRTRPPEYFVLIDLPTDRDHAGRFADTLIAAIEQEGLFVTRYFYRRNPRICFREPGGPRVYLADLTGKYQDCRLIVCGCGDDLLDPVSGEFADWTDLLRGWRERALLTPVPPAEWGRRERTLAQEFVLAPATVAGLAALGDLFAQPEQQDLRQWRVSANAPAINGRSQSLRTLKHPYSGLQPASALSLGIDAQEFTEDVDDLRKVLGDDVFYWLCACAVYPELHWELTLFFAALPGMSPDLLTEANLLRLIRLPYFQTGFIPDETRWALLSALPPAMHQAMRGALIDMLARCWPDRDSPEYEGFALQLALQRLVWREIKRRLEKSPGDQIARLKAEGRSSVLRKITADFSLLRRVARSSDDRGHAAFSQEGKAGWKPALQEAVQDYTLLRFLETTRVSPLTLVLPPRFRKLLYARGVPLFGFSTLARAAFTAIAIALIWLGSFVAERTIIWQTWTERSTGMEFVRIKGVCFCMGQTEVDKAQIIQETGEEMYKSWYVNELPRHEVCVDDFWLGKYEVTNAQYRKFKAKHDSGDYEGQTLNDDNQPVVLVSWEEATAFAEWLTTESNGQEKFRLPTEAEWEYATRAGTATARYWGDDPEHTRACDYANVTDETTNEAFKRGEGHKCKDGYVIAAPVGRFRPNAFGLYDLLGNVWEWNADWYDSYASSSQKNPTGPIGGSLRVGRGGSWGDGRPPDVRSAYRGRLVPSDRGIDLGFRLVRTK